MQYGPLVSEEIEAASRFLAGFQKYAPVQAAFWVKGSDETRHYLYLAAERVTDRNVGRGYHEVLRIAAELRDAWFDPFTVKLISAGDRLAKAALELRQRYPGHTPARLFGQGFGGMDIEEVYVYPSPHPPPATEDNAAAGGARKRRRAPRAKK